MWQEETFEERWRDPIVEEIRRIRQQQAARFDYNVRAIVEDARSRQQQGDHKVVSLPPRRIQVADKPEG